MDKVCDVKCSMTVSNVRDRRVLESYLRAYNAESKTLSEEPSNDRAYHNKNSALGGAVSVLAHYCSGEIDGRDLSKALELEDLDDSIIIHLAESVLGHLKDEMGKSERPSLPSLRVVQA